MAPPFAKVEFDLMYGEGISFEGDLVDLATKYELVEKSGAWYSLNGERMGQGRDQAKQYLRDNKAGRLLSLRRKILELNKIGVITATDMVDKDDAKPAGGDLLEDSAPKKLAAPAALAAKVIASKTDAKSDAKADTKAAVPAAAAGKKAARTEAGH